jgi:hypothetical protein
MLFAWGQIKMIQEKQQSGLALITAWRNGLARIRESLIRLRSLPVLAGPAFAFFGAVAGNDTAAITSPGISSGGDTIAPGTATHLAAQAAPSPVDPVVVNCALPRCSGLLRVWQSLTLFCVPTNSLE